MTLEHDEHLCKTYPRLFTNPDGSPTCWDFSCGDGWYPILDTLCRCLMRRHDELQMEIQGLQTRLAAGRPQHEWESESPEDRLQSLTQTFESLQMPSILQMKEKFGTLRVYAIGGAGVHELIEFAELMSAVTCETCGAPGTVRVSKRSWIKTRCDACDKEKKDTAGYGYGV